MKHRQRPDVRAARLRWKQAKRRFGQTSREAIEALVAYDEVWRRAKGLPSRQEAEAARQEAHSIGATKPE